MSPSSRFAALAALAALAACVATSALTGCEKQGPKVALNYTQDAKRAYDEAMEEFHAHNWIESQALFREVKRKYSYSRYARLAELRIADADFEQDKFADAIRGYRQFVHDHRSDNEEVSYARARIAEAQYKEISDSFLLPAAEERDQATVMDAYKELKGYLHDYPNAKESPHSRELLADVTARLVRHELYVARFYLQRDNYEAATSRVLYALKNFSGAEVALGPDAGDKPLLTLPVGTTTSGSGLEPEALLLLGETYLKMHRWTDARRAFSTILTTYRASALSGQAQDYLRYLKSRGV
jgi:outer membrane protein assembly factor BamD